MNTKLINSYINLINKENIINEENLGKIRYSLEGLFLSISKSIFILLIAILIGFIKETIYILLFSKLIRYFSFGYHAKNSRECLLYSLILFIIIPYLFLLSNILIEWKSIIFIISILNFTLFAPSDTRKRPLRNKRKRLLKKHFTILITAIYFFITFFTYNTISKILIISVIINVLLTNPFIYFISKDTYRNYLIN